MSRPRQPTACPICGLLPPADAQTRRRPFCSPRCAEVDLGRWFAGSYAIPATEAEPGEETNAEYGG